MLLHGKVGTLGPFICIFLLFLLLHRVLGCYHPLLEHSNNSPRHDAAVFLAREAERNCANECDNDNDQQTHSEHDVLCLVLAKELVDSPQQFQIKSSEVFKCFLFAVGVLPVRQKFRRRRLLEIGTVSLHTDPAKTADAMFCRSAEEAHKEGRSIEGHLEALARHTA